MWILNSARTWKVSMVFSFNADDSHRHQNTEFVGMSAGSCDDADELLTILGSKVWTLCPCSLISDMLVHLALHRESHGFIQTCASIGPSI